jgi:hypothetical protein
MYAFAGERVRAFTQIFPEIEAEFHLAIRNPATFLPAALSTGRRRNSYDEFMENGVDADDPALVRRDQQIVTLNPGVPLVIWADEDTPLIWPEVLQAVSGHAEGTALEDTDELLAGIMSPDGLVRMRNYVATHPPQTDDAAAQDRVGVPRQVRPARTGRSWISTMPGWTEDMVAEMTALYEEDVARIAAMPEITFLAACRGLGHAKRGLVHAPEPPLLRRCHRACVCAAR